MRKSELHQHGQDKRNPNYKKDLLLEEGVATEKRNGGGVMARVYEVLIAEGPGLGKKEEQRDLHNLGNPCTESRAKARDEGREIYHLVKEGSPISLLRKRGKTSIGGPTDEKTRKEGCGGGREIALKRLHLRIVPGPCRSKEEWK